MEKKISVSMESDQITLIEVDGTQYASADDIANPEDREKVTTLISQMENDPSGEDIEQFKKEFEAMRQKTSKLPLLIGSIFLGVAAILLGIAILTAIQAARTVAKEKPAPGQVVDLVERSSRDTKTGEVQVYSYPVVTFTPANGKPVRVQLAYGSWPPAYNAGEAVTVLYDPDRPQNARIQSAGSAVVLFILPAITGTMGLIFLTVALAFLRSLIPRAA